MPLDVGATVRFRQPAYAFPERLGRIRVPYLVEDADHVSGEMRLRSGLVERTEIAERGLFALELTCLHLRPARLEEVAEVSRLPPAHFEGLRAARMKRAAERRTRRVRHLAAREVTRHAAHWIGLRDGTQQRLRVRMFRVRVDRVCRADLHDPPQVHDRDAIAEELRRREIVRDVEIREVELVLELEHQLEDLRAHAHVEHRHGLVAHEQRRIEDDRPRENGSLFLSARQV